MLVNKQYYTPRAANFCLELLRARLKNTIQFMVASAATTSLAEEQLHRNPAAQTSQKSLKQIQHEFHINCAKYKLNWERSCCG